MKTNTDTNMLFGILKNQGYGDSKDTTKINKFIYFTSNADD